MIGKKFRKWLVLGFGLPLAIVLGAALSQTDDSASSSEVQNAAPVEETEAAKAPELNPDAAAVEPQDALGVEADQASVPEAILEAIENQDTVHATMDRFIPTEKLSEDRAVSFPNDI